MDEEMPYTITGPAMVKIFEATPVIKPSLLDSIASEVMAFANPEIGTKAPPPPNFAILSKKPKPVEIAVINIIESEAKTKQVSLLIPKYRYNCKKNSAIKQIVPPTTNAFIQFFKQGDCSARFSV